MGRREKKAKKKKPFLVKLLILIDLALLIWIGAAYAKEKFKTTDVGAVVAELSGYNEKYDEYIDSEGMLNSALEFARSSGGGN